MNKESFIQNHSGELKVFLDTPCGQALMNMLGALRPPYEFGKEVHLLIENRGAMRGYEQCLRNIIGLSFAIPKTSEPEANYGVTKPEEKE